MFIKTSNPASLLFKKTTTVPKIKRGLEKWVKVKTLLASFSFKRPCSYNFLVYFALLGKPEIILITKTKAALELILKK